MKDCIDIKIYYEDTDCGGVVYYGKYLAYLERARIVFLERRGVSLVGLMKKGIYFVVTNATISYHMPARYGDTISVYSEIEAITPATITFSHEVLKKNTENLLVTSSVKLACVNSHTKPIRLKSNILEALNPKNADEIVMRRRKSATGKA